MFAQLGDIKFDLITYFDGLTATKKIDYAEHATIEGKPKLQYIGEALEILDLKLTFHISFCNPAEELKKLKDAASEYKPLPLVFGNGVYRGNYVIEEIKDNIQQTFREGTLWDIEVEVKLKEWVKDRVIQSKKEKTAKPAQTKKQTKKQTTDVGSYPKGKIVRQEQ